MKTIFVVMVSSLALVAGCLEGTEDSGGAGGRAPEGAAVDNSPPMACVKTENMSGCGDPSTKTSCETVYSADHCQSSQSAPVYLDTCAFSWHTTADLYAMTCEQWSQQGNH